MYWWNEDIATKRRTCIILKRAFQRAGRRGADRKPEHAIYKHAKMALRMAIRASQENAWRKLQEKVEPIYGDYIIDFKKAE